MTSAARTHAFRILQAVCLRGAHSDDSVHADAVSGLDPRDRSLVTEIVFGTLRWQARLDHYLEPLVTRPWRLVHPGARILLRMSLYQLWRLNRVPARAVVHDAVEMARAGRLSRAAGFVNAVLRGAVRTKPWENGADLPPWIEFSLPRWLWERWAGRFGPEPAARYAATLNEPAPLAFRSGGEIPADSRPSEVVPGAWLADGPGASVPGRGLRPAHRYQDEASQLIPFLLGPVRGWRIWDACAAPGGKSALLRELAGAEGTVLSTDVDPGRVARLHRLASGAPDQAGHWVVCADARLPAPCTLRFDAVLVDAPCSGLGTLRRNPEIRWRCRPDRLKELAMLQLRILCAASGSVRPGGRLLYATCSTEPEENEQVVGGFLATHPGFELVRPGHPEGICDWTDGEGYVRTFPSERRWDGFFAALMLRL